MDPGDVFTSDYVVFTFFYNKKFDVVGRPVALIGLLDATESKVRASFKW